MIFFNSKKINKRNIYTLLLIIITIVFSIYLYKTNFLLLYFSYGLLCIYLLKYIIKKYDYFFYILFIILYICIILEVSCLYFISKNESSAFRNNLIKKEIKSKAYSQKDKLIWYRYIPNLSPPVNVKLLVWKRVIYNINYASDSYGRRIGVKQEYFKKERKHAIFFWWSYTFGEGIPYNETFPYILEKKLEDTISYNYGFRWFWPHQTALLFENHLNIVNSKSVPEQDWFAIYTYIDEHHNRVFWWSRYLWYGASTPDIRIVGRDINISLRNSLFIKIAKIMRESSTFRYFNISITYPKNTHHYKRFSDIINYTKEQYKDTFPNGHFYVAIYPDRAKKDLNWIKFLDEDIIVIDVPMPKNFESNKEYYVIDKIYDHHPNGNLNRYFVKYLLKVIK